MKEDREQILRFLEEHHPLILGQSEIIEINDYYFVISREDMPKLTEKHYEVLKELTEPANNPELHNPVFVELDEDGVLLID